MTTKSSKTTKAKSTAFKAIHCAATGLHRAGAIDKATMREFDSLCLESTPVFKAHSVKRIIKGIEVDTGSSNVFADLGLPHADKLKIKSGLVIEITQAIRKLGLTQQDAAKRMGITQPKVSDMLRGDFSNLSERKLMDCLNRLGYDIEIKVKPASKSVGHLLLAVA
jgi:predicted XRE-type DNA-binding protein